MATARVEVKYVNGTFRITRDRWRYVKYDNYGNPVEEGTVRDRGGRPPNVQLTEPLAVLEEFLAKRGQPVRMQPVVLLDHPKARIDRCAWLSARTRGSAAASSARSSAWSSATTGSTPRAAAADRDQASLPSRPGASNPGQAVTGRRG